MNATFTPRLLPYIAMLLVLGIISFCCIYYKPITQDAYIGQLYAAGFFGLMAILLIVFAVCGYEQVSITDEHIALKGIFSQETLPFTDILRYGIHTHTNLHYDSYDSWDGGSIKTLRLYTKGGDTYQFNDSDYSELDEMIVLITAKLRR